MRKCEDKLYQRLYPDVMVLSDDDEHPYLYGRIIDIFHADVSNNASNSMLQAAGNTVARLEMVWVRWLKFLKPDGPSGFHSLRRPSVAFYPGDDPDAFGFIHPDEILRAVHLIPHFKLGRTRDYLKGPTRGRPADEMDDWVQFSVNMYDISTTTPRCRSLPLHSDSRTGTCS